MKVGMFGGSFDPPHNGHIVVAEHVADRLGLARVVLVPSAIPPHKQDRMLSSSEDRLEMCRRAAEDRPLFAVSDIEIRRQGVSYTVDTLTELRGMYGGAELYLLIGMDNYLEFHLWKDPEKILELAVLVVMSRPGYEESSIRVPFSTRIRLLEVPAIDLSSTHIRALRRRGLPVGSYVPEAVNEYIMEHHLYE